MSQQNTDNRKRQMRPNQRFANCKVHESKHLFHSP
ncbi:hypothetical protein TorRG33x02_074840 [Trema orientale]|uniref:Uncharacterized protein n=1 Tax=Trema orientale TaxID=63057 RepID=A0A2P5FG52_TREOI|nr:hypothetical protein TorRG33x02_074840 [Trema orientale]